MARPNENRVTSCLKGNLLTILTVLGVVGGCVLGFILRFSREGKWKERESMYVAFLGDIFLRMLKSLIIPLLVSSIVSAIGALDLSLSKKIAFRAISYYVTTTLSAVTLGIILVITIRPGIGRSSSFEAVKEADKPVIRNVTTTDTLLDLVRNLFPPNLIQATLQQYKTTLIAPENATDVPLTDFKIKPDWSDSTNVLGLVVFSIVFGITLGKMGEAGKPLLDFFNALSEAMMVVTKWVIWVSPIGVFFLVTAKILEINSLEEIAGKLSLYFITVLIGLFIHGFGSLSIIYFVCTRELPFKFIGKMSQVLVTAFGTASSSATMPITIECMDNCGIDPRISRFVIPIGATINMDGTALYEAVAALFIAQIRNIPLSFGSIVAVSVTATAASIGAAGIPQAGLVTMVMVLDTVGLPAEDVTLIIAVDWLLDRFRTTINVMCDALGAKIVDSMSKNDIKLSNDLELERAIADPTELVEIVKADDTRL